MGEAESLIRKPREKPLRLGQIPRFPVPWSSKLHWSPNPLPGEINTQTNTHTQQMCTHTEIHEHGHVEKNKHSDTNTFLLSASLTLIHMLQMNVKSNFSTLWDGELNVFVTRKSSICTHTYQSNTNKKLAHRKL